MKQFTLFIFLVFAALCSYAQDLRITEIMYNPSNSDSAWEWVEVYNAGEQTIDLSGYVIDDNSGAPYNEANIPSGSIISGQSAILFNASAISEIDFRNVWGTVNLIPVTRWSSLNNGGDTIGIWNSFETYSGDNSSQENVIEQVAYAADGEIWPEDDGSASIYLTDLELDNNLGSSWLLSTVGAVTPIFKAYTSNVFESFDGEDVASPGLSSTTDTEKPTITCPENIDMAADTDNCGSTFPFLIPKGLDNITEELVFEGIRSDGLELTDIYPVGLTTITWMAIDEAGNVSDSCDQLILITDNVPPTINCSDSIEVTSLNGNAVTVEIDFATSSNACEGELILNWIRSDEKELQEPFPIGITTITWTATDASDNVAECTQIVTVSFNGLMDNDISSFSVPDQLENSVIDIENKTVLVKVPFGTIVDALIPAIEVSEGASVTPENGEAQNFSNPVEYIVKAENGSEQIWTVIIQVQDDLLNPVIECPNDIIVQNDEGECGAVVEFDVTFSDADESAILELSIESGSTFPVGTTEVTAVATDGSGNSASCKFNVTVEDNIIPILICKDATVQLDAGGNVNILITDVFDTLS
ncbi:MAG: HYR domain-containing protein, partial [Maribacter sp.]